MQPSFGTNYRLSIWWWQWPFIHWWGLHFNSLQSWSYLQAQNSKNKFYDIWYVTRARLNKSVNQTSRCYGTCSWGSGLWRTSSILACTYSGNFSHRHLPCWRKFEDWWAIQDWLFMGLLVWPWWVSLWWMGGLLTSSDRFYNSKEEHTFSFLDPNEIIWAAHLIPASTHPSDTLSHHPEDSTHEEWKYYVNMYVYSICAPSVD